MDSDYRFRTTPMAINHTAEIAKLNEIISDLLQRMTNAKTSNEYDSLYEQFETAHDRRETLQALAEADAFYVTEED